MVRMMTGTISLESVREVGCGCWVCTASLGLNRECWSRLSV